MIHQTHYPTLRGLAFLMEQRIQDHAAQPLESDSRLAASSRLLGAYAIWIEGVSMSLHDFGAWISPPDADPFALHYLIEYTTGAKGPLCPIERSYVVDAFYQTSDLMLAGDALRRERPKIVEAFHGWIEQPLPQPAQDHVPEVDKPNHVQPAAATAYAQIARLLGDAMEFGAARKPSWDTWQERPRWWGHRCENWTWQWRPWVERP
jgi:hypothetical protein